eukprot:548388-Rhodomonas_salina.1
MCVARDEGMTKRKGKVPPLALSKVPTYSSTFAGKSSKKVEEMWRSETANSHQEEEHTVRRILTVFTTRLCVPLSFAARGPFAHGNTGESRGSGPHPKILMAGSLDRGPHHLFQLRHPH